MISISSPFITHASSPTLAVIGTSKGRGITVHPARGPAPAPAQHVAGVQSRDARTEGLSSPLSTFPRTQVFNAFLPF